MVVIRIVHYIVVPLRRFHNSDGEVKYLRDAEELIRPERNTLVVSFTDLEGFNQELATAIQEEFYRCERSQKKNLNCFHTLLLNLVTIYLAIVILPLKYRYTVI